MNDSDLVTKRLDDMTVKKTLQPWQPAAGEESLPMRMRDLRMFCSLLPA